MKGYGNVLDYLTLDHHHLVDAYSDIGGENDYQRRIRSFTTC
jgi:hypothetical protein